jgi:hypothetical protein
MKGSDLRGKGGLVRLRDFIGIISCLVLLWLCFVSRYDCDGGHGLVSMGF